jgi:hypothetical protein
MKGRIGLRCQAPIIDPALVQLSQPDRDVHEWMAVGAPSLKQQETRLR